MNVGSKKVLSIINIGAGKDIIIDESLLSDKYSFVCDRVDIEKHQISAEYMGDIYHYSIESMPAVGSDKYIAAFACYVLEYVPNVPAAASEIYRVLKPSGIFATTFSNPTAPEFVLAKLVSLKFHKRVKSFFHGGKDPWETRYAFKNVDTLIEIFQKAGFRTLKVKYYSGLESHLRRFYLVRILARLYDKIMEALKPRKLMNTVVVEFQKPL